MLKAASELEHAAFPTPIGMGFYLEGGARSVEDGCLRFIAAGSDLVVAG